MCIGLHGDSHGIRRFDSCKRTGVQIPAAGERGFQEIAEEDRLGKIIGFVAVLPVDPDVLDAEIAAGNRLRAWREERGNSRSCFA